MRGRRHRGRGANGPDQRVPHRGFDRGWRRQVPRL